MDRSLEGCERECGSPLRVRRRVAGREVKQSRQTNIRSNGMSFEGNGSSEWMPVAAVPAESAGTRVSPAKSDDAGEKLAAEMKVFNDVVEELSGKCDLNAGYDAKVSYVLGCAAELFGVAPTWTAFYREVLGGNGLVCKCLSTPEEREAFECSEAHAKLFEMLTVLRSKDLPENDPHEPQRMITIRIPKSLHDSICDESNRLGVSVNKLCITRLLQQIDKSMIPSSGQKRRGRRPGSAGTKPAAAAENRPSYDSAMDVRVGLESRYASDLRTGLDS